MNNNASDDDALIAGTAAGTSTPIAVLFGGRGDVLRSQFEELLAANDQLLRAVGNVREFERVLAAGARDLRAGTQRIADLENAVAELESQMKTLSRERESAIAEAYRLRTNAEESRLAILAAEEKLKEMSSALELTSGRAAWAEKNAQRNAARIATLQAQLTQAAEAFRALEGAFDAAVADRTDAIAESKSHRAEAAAWVSECEALMLQVEQNVTTISALRDERQSLLALLEERNSELLSWLDTAEQLNDRVRALEHTTEQLTSARANAGQETQAARDEGAKLQQRCDELEAQLNTTREDARHWHGRCEALEVHLKDARTEGAQRADALQKQLDAETHKAGRLEKELVDLADRFTKITHVEIERTRSEIMHLSAAINNVQTGRAWRIKHWIRRLIGSKQ